MAHRFEKDTGDLVIDGFNNGISNSPHAGIADMKCMNINSLPGEAAVNYGRILALPVVTNGTMSASGGNNSLDYTPSGSNQALIVGSCVQVSTSTITNFTNSTGGGPNSNRFWIKNITSAGVYQFSLTYNGATITNFGLTGTATFSTVVFSKFIQGTDEFIQSRNQTIYYLVDATSQVWANDPNVYGVFSPAGTVAVAGTTNCQGFGVSQGVITVFVENMAVQRFTNRIGDDSIAWDGYGFFLNTPVGSTASHRAIRSQVANGALLYPDSQFIGLIQGANPQFSLIRGTTPGGGINITTTSVEQGVLPIFSTPNLIVGVYASQGGSLPAELDKNTTYYIVEVAGNNGTFQLSTTDGGGAITISNGNFYVTTFDPDVSLTFVVNSQALPLPYNEQATALAEISLGNVVNLVIGGITQNIYFWDESTSGYITVRLPEGAAGTSAILNVNNNAFVFAGNKGTIYLTNASGMAGTLTVPDYCANVNGDNQDPFFIWGTQPAILRGRVFFSIQDQTSTHTGNCGGIWSFTPPQNGAIETNLLGAGLHLENESSYGTYNGICNVILPLETQQAKGPQYYSAWTSDSVTPTYGIDSSSTTPYTGGQPQIDTELIPVGTYLGRKTFSNMEYKLSRPLKSGESIMIQWRPDLTTAFSAIGTGPGGPGIDNTVGNVGFAFPLNFQTNTIPGSQWAQFRINTTAISSSSSFVPLVELRLHQ